MVTVDYDGVSTKLMIILMIELGIWVIRACPNFIRSGHTFEGKWLLLINDSGGVLVFEGKWVTMERA